MATYNRPLRQMWLCEMAPTPLVNEVRNEGLLRSETLNSKIVVGAPELYENNSSPTYARIVPMSTHTLCEYTAPGQVPLPSRAIALLSVTSQICSRAPHPHPRALAAKKICLPAYGPDANVVTCPS